MAGYDEKITTEISHGEAICTEQASQSQCCGKLGELGRLYLDDGVMNAYVHYLLVDPDYHGKTIGRTLVSMVKEKYKDYMRIVVVAYDDELQFYEACGFEKSKDASPMFITSLWT